MKKVTRTAAMIALMLGALTVTANEGKLSLITNAKSSSIVFESDSRVGETTIKLFDVDQNVIYFESIGKGSYAKRFNLKNLKDGVYYFVSEDSLKTMTYTIKVDGQEVSILDKVEDTKPVFRKKDGKVYLNLLNLDKKDVEIVVFDSYNRMVFSEKFKDTAIIKKAFNFKKAYEDSYTLEVTKGENTYYETMTIE